MIREEPQGIPNRRPIALHSSPGGARNSSISFTTGMITTHTHTGIGNNNVGTDIGMWSLAPVLSMPSPQSLPPFLSPSPPTWPPPLSLVRPPLSPTGALSLASRPAPLPAPLLPAAISPAPLSPTQTTLSLPGPPPLARPMPSPRPLSLSRQAALLSPTQTTLSLSRPRPLSLSRPSPLSPRPLSLSRPSPLSPRPPLSLSRPSPLSPTRTRPLPLAGPSSLSSTRPRPVSLNRPPQSLVRPRRPSLATSPPYTERVHTAQIGTSSFPLSSIGRDGNWDEIGISAGVNEDQGYREPPANVVHPSTSVAPPLLDNGSYVPDGTYDRDFLYAMRLQMEEYQGHEDGQMPMMDTVDLQTSTPTYNPHPGTMSNVVAGPSSRPLMTSTMTRTTVAAGTTTVLDLTCKCTGCFDSFKSFEGLQSSCGHYFCLPCVRNMVTASVSDESLFPPKCCQQPLMATFAEQMAGGGGILLVERKGKDRRKDEDQGFMQIKWLGLILDDNVLKEKMERRWYEWGVKGDERVYCSNASCAVFLGSATEFYAREPSNQESHPASANTTRSGSSSQVNHHGKKSSSSSAGAGALPIVQCEACATLTCVSCRGKAHMGQTCKDSKDVAFWNMVKKKRWRQCPACGVVIEKNGGCSHMACRCGNSFK